MKTFKGTFRINGRVLTGFTTAVSEAQAKTFFITRLMVKLNMSRVALASYFKNENYEIKGV